MRRKSAISVVRISVGGRCMRGRGGGGIMLVRVWVGL